MIKNIKYLITLLLLMTAISSQAQSTQRATGDVNGDGLVDIEDVSALVRQILSNKYEYVTLYDGYTVTAVSANTAYGTVTGSGVVATGKTITITASPNTGYQFDGWYNDAVLISTANPYSFTPTSDLQLTGCFSKQADKDTENPTGNMDEGQDE